MIPAVRASRRPICGATREMNAIGPDAAVTVAVNATPTRIRPRRASAIRTPWEAAVSSPSSICRIGRLNIPASTRSTAMKAPPITT